MSDSIRQEHVDNIMAALALIPDSIHANNFGLMAKAYMSLGWLSSEAEMSATDYARKPIDLAEDDAIRLSDRQPLMGG